MNKRHQRPIVLVDGKWVHWQILLKFDVSIVPTMVTLQCDKQEFLVRSDYTTLIRPSGRLMMKFHTKPNMIITGIAGTPGLAGTDGLAG